MYKGSCTQLSTLPEDDVRKFIDNIKTVIFSCDGVLWYNINKPITGAVEVYEKLVRKGKNAIIVTNNTMYSRKDLVERASKMGINFDIKQVISCSYLIANYLKNKKFNKKVYVVGANGITDELQQVGIESFGVGPDIFSATLEEHMEKINLDRAVGAVIIGFDVHISYTKMVKALTYLEDKKCLFLGTSADIRIPTDKKLVLPGPGSMLRAIETAAKRKAVLIGMPHSHVVDLLIKFQLNPKTTLIIGCDCEHDIILGNRCGYNTLLILTSTTTEMLNSYKKNDSKMLPDLYLDKISDLLRFLK